MSFIAMSLSEPRLSILRLLGRYCNLHLYTNGGIHAPGKQAKSRTSGGGYWQDIHPSSYNAQAVLREQLDGLRIQYALCRKHPRCQRLDRVIILYGHSSLQANWAMRIAGISEVYRATAEFHTRLEHRAVHSLTVKSLASKSWEQSGMHIHDASHQGWRWVIERQKTSQHH